MTTDGTVTASIGANKATDATGNGNSASTSTGNTVTWTVASPPTGELYARFLARLDASYTSTTRIGNKAKAGRVVPVQIQLYRGTTLQTSADIAEGDITIVVTKMTTCDNTATDDMETYAAAGASNTGNIFRWSGTKMIFNLDTGNKAYAFAVGSCYRMNVIYQNQTLISWAPALVPPATTKSTAANWWSYLSIVK